MALLEFIFASPWRFAGTIVLILAMTLPLSEFRPFAHFVSIERDDD